MRIRGPTNKKEQENSFTISVPNAVLKELKEVLPLANTATYIHLIFIPSKDHHGKQANGFLGNFLNNQVVTTIFFTKIA